MSNNILEELIDAATNDVPPPQSASGQVQMAQAYVMQLRVLERRLHDGRQLVGWKVGQTSSVMRAKTGDTQPAPGFLLGDLEIEPGGTLELQGTDNWSLEPELALIVGESISGPGVTVEDMRSATAAVAPAFEIVRAFPGWNDKALARAVNRNQAGYVLGARTSGCPERHELDELQVHVECSGETIADVRGADVNDNPLETAAWLANHLGANGYALQPGQIILTGSYTALLPVQAGQSWRTQIADSQVTLAVN